MDRYLALTLIFEYKVYYRQAGPPSPILFPPSIIILLSTPLSSMVLDSPYKSMLCSIGISI